MIYEYTREEEFIASRSRHPMRIRMKTGVKCDGTITANAMYVLSDTGLMAVMLYSYRQHRVTKSMALYVGDGSYRQKPNIRFYADIVYTNHPPAGRTEVTVCRRILGGRAAHGVESPANWTSTRWSFA